MGRFRCAGCLCTYYDKRFIWEADPPSVAFASTAHLPSPSMDCGGEAPGVAPAVAGDEGSGDGALAVQVPASARTVADTIRATGTAANFAGALAHGASAVFAPISSVAGVVGLAGGVTQLYQGLATPSGSVDPHLVTKGGIASGVGGTCMVLGACAAAAPPLFVVSLALGALGLSATTLVDSMMDGLCPTCRGEAGPPL